MQDLMNQSSRLMRNYQRVLTVVKPSLLDLKNLFLNSETFLESPEVFYLAEI